MEIKHVPEYFPIFSQSTKKFIPAFIRVVNTKIKSRRLSIVQFFLVGVFERFKVLTSNVLTVDNLMCFKRNPFHDFKKVWSRISSWSGLSFQKSQCVHMRRRFMPATKVNRAIWSAPRVSGLLIPGECSYEGFRIPFFLFGDACRILEKLILMHQLVTSVIFLI